jgi:hypothetical protein
MAQKRSFEEADECDICKLPLPEVGSDEYCALQHIHAAMKESMPRFLARGNQETAKKQASVSVFQCIVHPHLNGCCRHLRAATRSVLGISQAVLKTACERRGTLSNQEMDQKLLSGEYANRKTRSDCYDKMVVYQFFHGGNVSFDGVEYTLPDYSALVEVDKSKKDHYLKKTFTLPGGPVLKLSCQHKCRRGSVAMLSREYLLSETFAWYQRLFPGHSISEVTIQRCICHCIKEEVVSECACPLCADMEVLIRGLRKHFGKGCKNKDCSDCNQWLQALSSVNAWMDHVSCSPEELQGYERAGSEDKFYLRPLKCCLEVGEAVGFIRHCKDCTFDKKLPQGRCSAFSKEKMDSMVTWLTRQPTVEGPKLDRLVSRLRDYHGKYSELVEMTKKKTKPYMRHLWRCRLLRRCFHLDCEFFDGDTEAVILADFASQMVFGSGYKSTCETDSTCNLYVVLVLYKKKQPNGDVKTVCDYIRIWSPAASSAAFHHKALKDTVDYLKSGGRVPNLKRVRIWTDGDPSTYKGFPNFGRMAEFTKHEDIEIIHCFFESAHASGVQDSAGKDPRIKMTKLIGFKDLSVYSYHHCQEWSIKNMPFPDQNRLREGAHFVANGDYVWWAYSDGNDEHKEKYPHIDLSRKEYRPIDQSSSMYEFSTSSGADTTVITRIIPCRCKACRARGQAECDRGNLCPHFLLTGIPASHDVRRTKTFTLQQTLDRKNAAKLLRKEKLKKKIAALHCQSIVDINPLSVGQASALIASHASSTSTTPPQDGGEAIGTFEISLVDNRADTEKTLEAQDEVAECLDSTIIDGMLTHCNDIKQAVESNKMPKQKVLKPLKLNILATIETLKGVLLPLKSTPVEAEADPFEKALPHIMQLAKQVDSELMQLKGTMFGSSSSSSSSSPLSSSSSSLSSSSSSSSSSSLSSSSSSSLSSSSSSSSSASCS